MIEETNILKADTRIKIGPIVIKIHQSRRKDPSERPQILVRWTNKCLLITKPQMENEGSKLYFLKNTYKNWVVTEKTFDLFEYMVSTHIYWNHFQFPQRSVFQHCVHYQSLWITSWIWYFSRRLTINPKKRLTWVFLLMLPFLFHIQSSQD